MARPRETTITRNKKASVKASFAMASTTSTPPQPASGSSTLSAVPEAMNNTNCTSVANETSGVNETPEVDETPEVNVAGEQLPPSVAPSKKRARSTRQNPNKKKKGVNFIPQEDVAVVRAWLSVSIDAEVGTNQTAPTYWQRIFDHFEGEMPGTQRTVDSMATDPGKRQQVLWMSGTSGKRHGKWRDSTSDGEGNEGGSGNRVAINVSSSERPIGRKQGKANNRNKSNNSNSSNGEDILKRQEELLTAQQERSAAIRDYIEFEKMKHEQEMKFQLVQLNYNRLMANMQPLTLSHVLDETNVDEVDPNNVVLQEEDLYGLPSHSLKML
ncbi:hypothetical protein MBANPS3_011201 [Mucor bainieri]